MFEGLRREAAITMVRFRPLGRIERKAYTMEFDWRTADWKGEV